MRGGLEDWTRRSRKKSKEIEICGHIGSRRREKAGQVLTEAFIFAQLDRAGLGHNTFTQDAIALVVRSAEGLLIKDSYWRWPERNLAGNTIDFFAQVLGLSFNDAMNQITGS
jgi:hypothetical protein